MPRNDHAGPVALVCRLTFLNISRTVDPRLREPSGGCPLNGAPAMNLACVEGRRSALRRRYPIVRR
jgi:hypothetical protein